MDSKSDRTQRGTTQGRAREATGLPLTGSSLPLAPPSPEHIPGGRRRSTYAYIPAAAVDVLPQLSGAEARILIALGSFMSGKGKCWPSYAALHARSGVKNRGALCNALAKLQALGVLAIQRRGPKTSLYTWIAPEEVPQSGTTKAAKEVPQSGTSRPKRSTAFCTKEVPLSGTGNMPMNMPKRKEGAHGTAQAAQTDERKPSFFLLEILPEQLRAYGQWLGKKRGVFWSGKQLRFLAPVFWNGITLKVAKAATPLSLVGVEPWALCETLDRARLRTEEDAKDKADAENRLRTPHKGMTAAERAAAREELRREKPHLLKAEAR